MTDLKRPDMDINIAELEGLAKAACLPWHTYKECQLDDQHEEIRDAQRCYVMNKNDPRDDYILAACNAMPGLIVENKILRRALELIAEDFACTTDIFGGCGECAAYDAWKECEKNCKSIMLETYFNRAKESIKYD